MQLDKKAVSRQKSKQLEKTKIQAQVAVAQVAVEVLSPVTFMVMPHNIWGPELCSSLVAVAELGAQAGEEAGTWAKDESAQGLHVLPGSRAAKGRVCVGDSVPGAMLQLLVLKRE